MQRVGTARERLLGAAVELFGEHGVSGTSLQTIADRLGVTKAAVYHQFQSKDAIVLAVIEPALSEVTTLADTVDRHRGRTARLDAALTGIVDLVVRHVRVARVLSFDPAVARLVREHPALEAVVRLRQALHGPGPDPGTRVRVAMLGGALIMAGADPDLAGLGEAELSHHLLTTARRMLR